MIHKISNKDRLYGNIQVYSPDLKPMFKANAKKIKWYLSHNGDNGEKLAEVYEWDGENPKSIKLLFIPKGYGHFEKFRKDEYYASEKKNICVVSGESQWESLTKHHIVPTIYRKWFPMEYKSRNCHDIVLITQNNHYEYEKFALELKDKIAQELGLPTLAEHSRRISRKTSYKGMATAILNPNIPFEHKIDICIKFQNKTNLAPNSENLKLYLKSCDNEYRLAEFYGKMIVDHIGNLQAFVEMWRQHFIDTMDPKFMPQGWKVDRDMYL